MIFDVAKPGVGAQAHQQGEPGLCFGPWAALAGRGWELGKTGVAPGEVRPLQPR